MQFKLVTLATLLGSAASVLADNNSVVFSYSGPGCTGNVNLAYVANEASIPCGNTLSPATGGTFVSGSGCRTYYYTDRDCKNNYFGGNNYVPDTKCYTGVLGYSIKCPSSSQ